MTKHPAALLAPTSNVTTTTGIILSADDFAMTNGISRAIVELAEAHRISATSAMTNSAHWPAHATWLARLRGNISAGLHLNLTLGRPLGPMPKFAPDRTFRGIGHATSLALRNRLDRDEIAAEFERQIAAFEREMGFAPDHIDSHQHVHALPVIRDVLLEILARRYPARGPRPLIRTPSDGLFRAARRARAVTKAATLAYLTRGFRQAARKSGFPTNAGFGGITAFGESHVAADFKAACRALGPRHMVMCHPGFVDDELARIDPILTRRQNEFDALMRGGLAVPIWRPRRSMTGDPIDWARAWTGTR